MYGSNLISATCRPRFSSRQPIDEAARPLPRLETTPPVTKMYLGIRSPWITTHFLLRHLCCHSQLLPRRRQLQVVRPNPVRRCNGLVSDLPAPRPPSSL